MVRCLFMLSVIAFSCSSPSSQTLVWQDEFDGDQLDAAKWTAIIGDGCPELCGFGNEELQYYDEANVSLNDGILRLEARMEGKGQSKYSSGKLVTKGKGDWQYGRVEVRAKVPYGRGTWPAIWMLPTIEGRAMKWPNDGEIDIMEHVGYNQGMIYGTIHTELYNHWKGTEKNDSLLVADAHEAFHVYSIDWDHKSITWEIDGEPFHSLDRGDDGYDGWPFDQKFHLILNLTVGGIWGGKYGVDDSVWPQAMEVDYVRIYQ